MTTTPNAQILKLAEALGATAGMDRSKGIGDNLLGQLKGFGEQAIDGLNTAETISFGIG